MKLVYIEWLDACSETGWFHENEVEKWSERDNFTIQQIGWIYKENKKYLILVGRMSPEEGFETQYGHLQKIPKPWIKKRIDLTKYIK